jgi:O-antigen biosynthesis protein
LNIYFSRLLEDQRIIRHPQNPDSPLVSVIMPTYKLREGGEMNRRAIESVLNQTLGDFEFIIVDDGSLDGLFELLQEFQERDSRIVLIRHEVNSGLPAARVDEAIIISRGKYIAYMFEDDYWYPNALEDLVAVASEDDQDCMVYGSVEWKVIRANGAIEERLLGNKDFDYSLLKGGNYIANCAVLHTRSAMDICGMYDPHILIRRMSDFDLWLRMARVVPVKRCDKVVGKVESGTKYALGTTVDQDVSLTFRYVDKDRNQLLLPGTIHNYPINNVPVATTAEDAYRIREYFIIPFFVQHPAILLSGERKLALTNRKHPNRMLVTKGQYSTSIDVILGNFTRVVPEEFHSFGFINEISLHYTNFINFDTYLCYRTIDSNSLSFQMIGRQQGKTLIYLMDDNMFKFGTGYLEEEFQYLKPDTPGYDTLVREVSNSDLVISFSPYITNDTVEHNPRVVNLRQTILEKYVKDSTPIADNGNKRRLKYALLSGPIRKGEVQALWPQFQEFFARHKDEVEFHVWGMDPDEFGPLECPTYHRPFDYAYDHYIKNLKTERFDYIICPLFDDHDVKRSKSHIKYLESTAAGAVGIYSDAFPYRAIEDGWNGIKVHENDWKTALECSVRLAEQDRVKLFENAKAHILEEYTTESQVLNYLSAFECADLHNGLSSRSSNGGQASIAYFFYESALGGATLHMLSHARIARRYGFHPVLCLPENKPVDEGFKKIVEQDDFEVHYLNYVPYPWVTDLSTKSRDRSLKVMQWLRSQDIRMVHTVTISPEVHWAAYSTGIPIVASLHQHYETPEAYSNTDMNFRSSTVRQVSAIHSSSFRYASQWQEVLQAPAFCLRAPIQDHYFDGTDPEQLRTISEEPVFLVSGTLQPRKKQLEVIRALALLKAQGVRVKAVLMGYDNLLPNYVEECRSEIRKAGLEDQVTITGFQMDPKPFYEQADFILCASDDESMPQSILKAMAEGKRVISTPIGGVRELILDGFSGIVAEGSKPEELATAIHRAVSLNDSQWLCMIKNAHETGKMVCKEEVVAYQLLRLYNYAVEENRKVRAHYLEKQDRAIKLVGADGVDSFSQQEVWNAEFSPVMTVDGRPARSWHELTEGHYYIHRMIFKKELKYRVKVMQERLSGVIVAFATYQKKVEGVVEMNIRSARPPYTLLRRVKIDASLIEDNSPVTFQFDEIMGLDYKELIVSFKLHSKEFMPLFGIYEEGQGRKTNRFNRMLSYALENRGKLLGLLSYSSPSVNKSKRNNLPESKAETVQN